MLDIRFTRLKAPKYAKYLYIAFLVLTCAIAVSLILSGGSLLSTDTELSKTQGTALMTWGVITLIIGTILSRIAAELIIVLFRIHDELRIINDREAQAEPVSAQGFPSRHISDDDAGT